MHYPCSTSARPASYLSLISALFNAYAGCNKVMGILLLLLFTLTCFSHIPVFAAPPSLSPALSELSGNDILCEMTVISNSIYAPGIYAINPITQKISCLIPYGRRPVWSPTHTKFVYWYKGFLTLYDLPTKKTVTVGIGSPLYEDIYWAPNEIGLYYKGIDFPQPTEVPKLLSFKHDEQLKNMALFHHDIIEQVGKISFSSDYKQVAYESVNIIPGQVIIPGEIRISDVGGASYHTISNKELEGKICLNPHWQPNGHLIAFDAYTPTLHLQEVYLYDNLTGGLEKLSINGRIDGSVNNRKIINNKTNFTELFSLFEWSPKGDALLVLPTALPNNQIPLKIPIDKEKPVLRFGGLFAYIQDAKFSLTGDTFVIMRINSLTPWLGFPTQVEIVKDNGEITRIDIPFELRPISFDY